MDTDNEYFWPGDGELQVWVYEPNPVTKPVGYIKGGDLYYTNLRQFGVLDDERPSLYEVHLQKVAEALMDDGVIFFFVRVVTTTDMSDDSDWKSPTKTGWII